MRHCAVISGHCIQVLQFTFNLEICHTAGGDRSNQQPGPDPAGNRCCVQDLRRSTVVICMYLRLEHLQWGNPLKISDESGDARDSISSQRPASHFTTDKGTNLVLLVPQDLTIHSFVHLFFIHLLNCHCHTLTLESSIEVRS